jgi:hypothetical protein
LIPDPGFAISSSCPPPRPGSYPPQPEDEEPEPVLANASPEPDSPSSSSVVKPRNKLCSDGLSNLTLEVQVSIIAEAASQITHRQIIASYEKSGM